MKRHYEVMRTMRTNVLDSCELRSAEESLSTMNEAIRYRMNDLTSKTFSIPLAVSVSLIWSMNADIFIQQKLDPDKQFQNFACGLVRYPVFFLTRVLSDASIVQVCL
jgi:hypothetical protein